jgi:hypothetical protein
VVKTISSYGWFCGISLLTLYIFCAHTGYEAKPGHRQDPPKTMVLMGASIPPNMVRIGFDPSPLVVLFHVVPQILAKHV